MFDPPARTEFARIAALPEGHVDLAEAALWIAAEEYPDLRVAEYLRRIDAPATEADARVSRGRTTRAAVESLNDFLYREQGFTGNRADYYDARNSFLNDVLDRRTGIPITLAILYLTIAHRLGLDARGVG